MAHFSTCAACGSASTPWRARETRAALAIACALGCQDVLTGSGHVIEEERFVSGFDGVRLDTEGEIVLSQAETEQLTIEAEDNLVAELRTDVVGGKLVIRTRSNLELEPTRPIIYRLVTPNIHSIEIDGSGTLFAASIDSDRLDVYMDGSGEVAIGSLSVNQLRLGIDGSGDLAVSELVADGVESNIDGSGSIVLSGVVDTERIALDGSGGYDALELRARSGHAAIDGSGNVGVFVTEELSVDISGSGNVFVKGEARVSSRVKGSGAVRHAESPE